MTKKATGNQKLYRNAGVTTLVFEGQDFEPGSEFRATLSPEHEMQLLSGGHLELLEDQSTRADQAQAELGGDAPVDPERADTKKNRK